MLPSLVHAQGTDQRQQCLDRREVLDLLELRTHVESPNQLYMSLRHELSNQNLSTAGGNCAGLRPGCLTMQRSYPVLHLGSPALCSLPFPSVGGRVCRSLFDSS